MTMRDEGAAGAMVRSNAGVRWRRTSADAMGALAVVAACSAMACSADEEEVPAEVPEAPTEVPGAPVDFPGDWSCLDGEIASGAAAQSVPGSRANYTVSWVDLLPPEDPAPPSLVARGCLITDPVCSQALLGPDLIVAPEEPTVTLSLPTSFVGFIRFQPGVPGTEPSTSAFPTDYYLGGPLLSNVEGLGYYVFGERDRVELESALGEELALDRGALLLRALDCSSAPAPGVALQLVDETGAGWSVLDGEVVGADLPDTTRETDASGLGGFINLELGILTYQAVLPDGRTFGRVSARISDDRLTMGEVRPRYDEAH